MSSGDVTSHCVIAPRLLMWSSPFSPLAPGLSQFALLEISAVENSQRLLDCGPNATAPNFRNSDQFL